MKRHVCSLLVCLFFMQMGFSVQGAPPPEYIVPEAYHSSASYDPGTVPLILPSQLRRLAVHNAGFWSLPISCAGFPPYGNYVGSYRDPETDQPAGYGIFPAGTYNRYVFSSGIWIGGIVDGDTLVSSAYDNWWTGIFEFWPPDPEAGGIIRTGNFADDEFLAVYTDTVIEPYVTYFNPYDDTIHTPLGLKVTQRSYSWQDTLYDNFVIMEFVIENIGGRYINDIWFGINIDADIYSEYGPYSGNGWADDASGVLDTFLYDDDAGSRVVIPYSFDMDGDPGLAGDWETTSVRGMVSIALLAFPDANPQRNFNWWFANTNPEIDFGPRRVGTAEDPFRDFTGDFLGSAHRQEDKYYQMAHTEIDYNQIEMDIHDSADGWIPANRDLLAGVNDTKFLFSVGSFDLAADDSAIVAIAFVASDGFHIDADDFDDYFDPLNPQEFQSRLDYTELLINHRRADSVYASGLHLPNPGPPVGLNVVGYDNSQVTLAWNRSKNPTLAGYYVMVRDTVYDDNWRRAHLDPIADTTFTVSISNPTHVHSFTVTVVDLLGRESAPSFELPFIPATPHSPSDLTVMMEGQTPVLQWIPYSDVSLTAYMIYRSAWNGPYILYDSVSGLEYRDYGAESGVRYNYRVASKNDLQLESDPIGPVSALPMALDKGVLFYDMNYENTVHFDPYHRRYVDRLFHSVQPLIGMDYYDIEDGDLLFKKMADYNVVVFECEKRGGKFRRSALDSIRNYLIHGGKAIFLIPNGSTADIGLRQTRHYYQEGDFFHDLLHLDSAVTNGVVIVENLIYGDLMGCQPLTPEYPILEADPMKLAAAPFPIVGYLPISGCIFPHDSADYIYSYQSLYPDSTFHNQINGVRYIGDNYSYVWFNFPLTLMSAPGNVVAFRQALTDLGIDLTCGDINDDQLLDVGDVVGLLDFLFRGGPEPPDMDRADVNCDGEVNLGDVQTIINAVFLAGAELNCCP